LASQLDLNPSLQYSIV